MDVIKSFGILLILTLISCSQKSTPPKIMKVTQEPKPQKTETATFGAGCFWCVEAIFQRVDGVVSVVSGYAGGKVEKPSYAQVCTGATGHAEAVQVTYDPSKVSYGDILEIFWKTHDPTTPNQQGNDYGEQYRSVIFYHDAAQKATAEKYKRALDQAKIWDSPIVTEIVPFTTFYQAEDYHQNYYNTNQDKGYCRMVIQPKLEKLEKLFKDKLK